MDILPEYLAKIKDGTKKLEFRSWYSDLKYFPLKNTETKIIEAVIEIADVVDLSLLPQEEKDEILNEGRVSASFRENYDCRFCYVIKAVYNVH